MRAHPLWAAAGVASLACLAACSGRSGGDPVDYRIVTHVFEDGLAGIASGDFEQPARTYPPIPVHARYTHQLTVSVDGSNGGVRARPLDALILDQPAPLVPELRLELHGLAQEELSVLGKAGCHDGELAGDGVVGGREDIAGVTGR